MPLHGPEETKHKNKIFLWSDVLLGPRLVKEMALQATLAFKLVSKEENKPFFKGLLWSKMKPK